MSKLCLFVFEDSNISWRDLAVLALSTLSTIRLLSGCLQSASVAAPRTLHSTTYGAQQPSPRSSRYDESNSGIDTTSAQSFPSRRKISPWPLTSVLSPRAVLVSACPGIDCPTASAVNVLADKIGLCRTHDTTTTIPRPSHANLLFFSSSFLSALRVLQAPAIPSHSLRGRPNKEGCPLRHCLCQIRRPLFSLAFPVHARPLGLVPRSVGSALFCSPSGSAMG
jgi:hypothetical protein